MKIDPITGQIAYHAIVFQEHGPTIFRQYDFDGSVEYEELFRADKLESKYETNHKQFNRRDTGGLH